MNVWYSPLPPEVAERVGEIERRRKTVKFEATKFGGAESRSVGDERRTVVEGKSRGAAAGKGRLGVDFIKLFRFVVNRRRRGRVSRCSSVVK